MAYTQAFVFCEGSDDQLFVEKILHPRLSEHFNLVKVVTYAQKKSTRIQAYVQNVLRSGGTVFFLTDFDVAPSTSECVATVRDAFGKALNATDVYVVVQEIESWYLAGVSRPNDIPSLGLAPPRTDEVTKEDFNALLDEAASRVEVMAEILERFDLQTGRSRNHSLEYFCAHVLDNLSS